MHVMHLALSIPQHALPGTLADEFGGAAVVAWGIAGLLALLLAGSLVTMSRLRAAMHRSEREQEKTLQRLIHRRDELEAALRSMVEGVLAVDTDGKLISLNAAAAKLLELTPPQAIGRAVAELIRNDALRQFIAESLDTDQVIETDIELPPDDEEGASPRMFEAQGSVLRDSESERIGSLIVLHNVTRLRRLEVVRRDFVTNASHEIKTPITAIKAAAETLLESANDDPQASEQFLRVITRQADRLGAIVEDLLSLARIEQDTEHERIVLEPRRLEEVLRVAAEACAARARDRDTAIDIDCAANLAATVNAPLLEQAVVNLIDNAIKYSPDGSSVRTSAKRVGTEIVLAVQDAGVGIAAEHLPRIFERFYRTDKARSRELGGTGLGLSIVKHIAIAHGGRVSVDSAPNRGSTFRIHIPANHA
ncbi:MAG: PAS domain-containing protein [Phycisphaera sp.]|nr:PAS domain-containing protein [Phycisphaera sp.]